MLIRMEKLERIRSGEVTLAFRRWRRPTVKAGGTLTTAVGVLAIKSVETTSESGITETDAVDAGYASRNALLDDLADREGDLYRISLAYASEDPRISLRNDDQLTERAFVEVCEKLDRLDSASRVGSWTYRVLSAIAEHPMCPAADLAQHTGFEKSWLKKNVRKLKNLGLTISHNPGYELSPRGISVLRRLHRTAR